MFLTAERIIQSGGQINDMDFYVGILILLLLFDITRRVTGWGLTLLGLGFLVYGFYVKLSVYPDLNGVIITSVSKQIIAQLVFITEGVLGTAIGVSASYIILFILFGAFLARSGMGQLFNDLALAVAGHTKGGPAKVAVIASGFLGSINGSAIANVVTTGTFTIPLMKKIGYKKNFSGAVESAASVGGQILPPIMGAAAFIMAENLNVAYTKIILAGIIPALLFYVGILLQVHFRAAKRGLQGLPKSELPSVKEVIAERGHLIIPMLTLLYLLFSGKTPFYAAFWSIIATVVIAGSKRMIPVILGISLFLIFQPQLSAVLSGSAVPNVRSDWWELILIVAVPLAINLWRKRLRMEGDEVGIVDCLKALEEGAKTTVPVAHCLRSGRNRCRNCLLNRCGPGNRQQYRKYWKCGEQSADPADHYAGAYDDHVHYFRHGAAEYPDVYHYKYDGCAYSSPAAALQRAGRIDRNGDVCCPYVCVLLWYLRQHYSTCSSCCLRRSRSRRR